MVTKKPSVQFTRSRSSSRKPTSIRSWDADDEGAMSTEEEHGSAPSRPLTVAIPYAAGPFCPRRPNLKEILSGTSPAPWTLPKFMQYLSANLCLENLEFTMDAGRYGKHYAKMLSKAGEDATPPAKDCEYVRLLWVRLIDAYIAPNGSREVNLPSSVRDPILNAPTSPMPPGPETLDLAVRKTYELMEESVLVPFLNSCSEEELLHWNDRQTAYAPVEEHASMFSRIRKSRESSPPHSAVDSHTSRSYKHHTATGHFHTKHGATLTTSLSNTSDANLSGATWSGPGMTDDSGSTGSPTNESPMTPPLSPPVGELYHSLSSSPKQGRDSGMWRKLGRLGGMKAGKKKSSGFADESTNI